MSCPNHPEKAYILKDSRLVCPECFFVSPYQHEGDLIVERNAYRKALEDICESYDHSRDQIDRVRQLLKYYETH
ncbi:hypothetical protein LCGC14_2069250 [marine sediment metagenome]|uniref:Uncharacterized protein n=1 Tax=marine sediment metagenome TaxID=412755 RepID=A0A0F9EIS1_9ZZZZ